MRYTAAEKSILERPGQTSSKDEIREKIEQAKQTTPNFDVFKEKLAENGVNVIERGKTLTYQHVAENKKVRAKKLGADYEKETIINGFERQFEPTNTRNDFPTTEPRKLEPGSAAIDPSLDRDQELQRSDAATEKFGESQPREQLTRDSDSDKYRPEQLQQQLEKLRNHTDQLQRDSSKAVNRILETPENDLERPFRAKSDRNREDSAGNEPEQPPVKRDQPDHHQDHGPSL